MSDRLELHKASHDEILEAHQNVFEHWNRGRTFEEHMIYRLYAPVHRRASWFVGTVDGKVVVSLGTYPFQFQVDGTVMPGSAIGSVFTVPEFRRRGYAEQLVNWTDNYHRDAGVGLSVLYSDIAPKYYAKCGYILCPSHEGWIEAGHSKSSSSSQMSFVEFDINDEFAEVATLYAEYHGAADISIVRGDSYWQSIIQKFPSDRWFWLQDADGGRAGYARIQRGGSSGRLTDYAFANRDEELAAEFYGALVAASANWDYERIGGWLPDSAAAKKFFDVKPREKEITMIKPLAYTGKLTPSAIASTDFFCEIDHV